MILIYGILIINNKRCDYMNEYIKILKEYDIEYLYHFTSIVNLSSILRYGILSVSEMNKNGVRYKCSDKYRNDNELDKISLSIKDYNRKMFYLKNNDTNRMVILELDVSLLDEGEPYFCYKNAADSEIRDIMKMDSKKLQTISAIDKMFKDNDVNDQVEILFKGNIGVKYINKIVVTSLIDKMVVMDILKDINLDISVEIIGKGRV